VFYTPNEGHPGVGGNEDYDFPPPRQLAADSAPPYSPHAEPVTHGPGIEDIPDEDEFMRALERENHHEQHPSTTNSGGQGYGAGKYATDLR